MNAVKIKNLKFSYEAGNENSSFRLAIPDWEITQGDFISLLGPNGCGKSTLLKLIARLHECHAGEIYIDGGGEIKKYSRKDLAKIIAYVPQKYFYTFPFSVYETVMMGRTPYLNRMGFEKSEDQLIVKEAMEILQIDGIKNKGINEISGGEAQRVLIARALAQKAKIILLDEPNAHLDLRHQIMIFELLRKLNETEKITVITVSHDLNLVALYSKKAALMEAGSIITTGEKADVLDSNNIKGLFKINAEIFNRSGNGSFNILINPRQN